MNRWVGRNCVGGWVGCLLVLGMLAGGALIPTGDAQASPAEKLLFIHDVEPAIAEAPAEVALEGMVASRSRPVTLNLQFAVEDGFAAGDTIVLDLFPDRHYTATVDRVTVNVNETISVRARIEGYPFGYLLVSTTEGRSLGSIVVPEEQERYLIMSPTQRDHFLLEIVEFAPVERHPPLIPPPPTREETQEIEQLQRRVAEEGLGPDDPGEIDVMIVYTPAARDWAYNYGGIGNTVAQAMEKAQLTLDNSITHTTLNLVHASLVWYTESGNSMTDLARLRGTADGYMDEVHEWRDDYGADLVALFAHVNDVAGVSYLLRSRSGRPDSGFSLTRVQQAATRYSYIHELGHNLGCHHNKEQEVSPGPTNWTDWPENTWSAGWRWTGDDGAHYCSVMSYTRGYPDGLTHEHVPNLSNPGVLHEEQTTGHAVDGDNARTVREVKHVIAQYRSAASDCTGCATPTSWSVRVCGGDKTVTLSTGGACTWSASSNASWLSVNPASGTGYGALTVAAEYNEWGSPRDGTVMISGLGWSASVDVDQVGCSTLYEDFGGLSRGTIPVAWTRSHDNWGARNANLAGGCAAPEMRFSGRYHYAADDTFMLTTPLLNAMGQAGLILSFWHRVFHWGAQYTLAVLTSFDGENWVELIFYSCGGSRH